MRRFIKTFIVFIYLILALFIQPGDVFACDSIGQDISHQYYISAYSKSKIHLINNKDKEYYVILKNNSRTEISKLSNKNQNYCFGSYDKANVDYAISNSSKIGNSICFTCISHDISPNLKNAIYTRAT